MNRREIIKSAAITAIVPVVAPTLAGPQGEPGIGAEMVWGWTAGDRIARPSDGWHIDGCRHPWYDCTDEVWKLMARHGGRIWLAKREIRTYENGWESPGPWSEPKVCEPYIFRATAVVRPDGTTANWSRPELIGSTA